MNETHDNHGLAELRKAWIERAKSQGDHEGAEHLQKISDEGLDTLVRIKLHRVDPQRYPHPGYPPTIDRE
jgi:hypothetical protein